MSVLMWQLSILALALLVCTSAAAPQIPQAEAPHTLLDIESPNSFSYSSPLRQPDSLRSRPYFDFLSTLYRRDSAKSELFRPYSRTRRSPSPALATDRRPRRAIVFRPLFVYKQQEIRKQEVQARRRAGKV